MTSFALTAAAAQDSAERLVQTTELQEAHACMSCRSSLEQLLKENYLTPGGEENVKCFFREEGYQTGISNVLKVLLSHCSERLLGHLASGTAYVAAFQFVHAG